MSDARPQLHVVQSELTYQAVFESPVLRLMPLESGSQDRLLVRLKPFGASIEALSVNYSWQDLSQSSFALNLLGGFASLRVWPHLMELRLEHRGESYPNVPGLVAPEPLSTVICEAESALRETDDRIRIATHSFIASLHGKLSGVSVTGFLETYVNPPPTGFPGTAKRGARYVFGPQGAITASWLLLEASMSIQPDGLFVNASVSFDGAQVPVDRAVREAAEYLATVTNSGEFPIEVKL